MPIFAIFGHFLAIFGRFGPFLDREHQKQCNCNLLGATGPTNYINMVSNGYLEIWSVSDPKTNSGAKQDPKLTWGGQNWSFCTLCSPTNLFYTKNVNSEMVTSKSYFLAWNRPIVKARNGRRLSRGLTLQKFSRSGSCACYYITKNGEPKYILKASWWQHEPL